MPTPSDSNRGRWQPGQSGNPAGRPKGATLASKLRELYDVPSEADPTITNAEALARLIIREALAGDIRFVSLLLDRVEGKPVAMTDMETDEPEEVLTEAQERLRTEAAKAYLAVMAGESPN